MIEHPGPALPDRELPVEKKKPSYLVGAVVGAASGVVALDLYVRINSLFLGSAAQVASAYVSGDMPTVQALLMTGAAVGAIAGVVRTAVNRRWGAQKDTIAKVAVDTASGFVAAPMATIGKCMVFPMKSTDRFSDRVQNYVRHRPHYPESVIAFLIEKIGLKKEWVIADVGSGTGISSELFLKQGNRVFAIEPNGAMREWAEKHFDREPNFFSIDGTAEDTSLSDESVDLIVAGQAFHWFAGLETKREFQRIARPDSYVLLMWNERDLASPFQREYEKMLVDLAVEYTNVCQRNIDEVRIADFFAPQQYAKASFAHTQHFDFDELKGRLLSSSYAPLEDHPNHQRMMKRLELLFDEFQRNGQVAFEYVCELYLGKNGVRPDPIFIPETHDVT